MAFRTFSERDISGCVGLSRDLVDLMRLAFAGLGNSETLMPPIMQFLMTRHQSQTCIKGAYLPAYEVLCLKVATARQQADSDRTERSGMMLLFDAASMRLRSLLMDNGYLTQLRTAAAGALCARLLAPKEVETAGVLGTGLQARLQMQAACLERQPKQLLVWGRNQDAAEALADRLAGETGIPARAARTAREVVSESQLVITATRSTEPIVEEDWLHPRLHITAMGSDAPGKCELAPGVLLRVSRYIPDSIDQCRVVGEYASLPDNLRNSTMVALTPLSEVCAGTARGRADEDEVTVADLTGTGVQDAAIAFFADQLLRQ